jgi:hypothetical protein
MACHRPYLVGHGLRQRDVAVVDGEPQAVEAWIACAESEPAIMLSWIRDVPSLGDAARRHAIPFTEVMAHRASLEQAYLELTGDAVDFRALGGSGGSPPWANTQAAR